MPSPLSGPLRRGPALVLALAALALLTSQAAAQTYRWDDGGAATNRNWDNPSNWFNITAGTNDGVPPPTADVQFGIGYTAPITVNLNGDRTVNSLAFGVPASTTLSGNTLTVTSGQVTVYGNQFSGTTATLPPTGSVVTAPTIIASNLALGTPGVFDVGGSAELQTNGVISVLGGGGVTRQGTGLWTIGGTANTFTSLTLAANLTSIPVATTRFGDVGTAAGGSLGVNAGGAANAISWGVSNRLLFTGSAPNQTLSKDISLVFNSSSQAIYSFETFNATGAVGPNAGSLTLAGLISGDLTNGGTAVSNSFNFNVASPTDPNFMVVLSGNNTFRATTTIQGGIVKLTNDNALGSASTVVQFGSGATGSGARTDAALLVNAGRTIAQKLTTFGASGDVSVYTVGGAPDFTSGTSTFSGAIDMGTGTTARGLTLAANGASAVVFSGAFTGTLGTGTNQDNKLVKVGTGTARLTASSAFTGAVEVRAGTLQLQGSGALTGTSGTVTAFTGGTLELNNTAGSVTSRVSTSRGIGLSGGTIALVSGSGTEGVLTVNAGAGSLTVDPAGGSSTLTFSSLARTGVGTTMGGTLDVQAVNGGVLGSTAKVVFTTAPTQTNGIIGGWATVNGTDFANYGGASVGVIPVSAYTPFASAGSTSNALVGNGATTDPVAAVNSVKVATTAPGGSLDTGGTLTVGTGGLLHTGGQSYTVASPLSTTTDLAVTTDGTLTLTGPVTAAGLSKAGAGTLVLGANVTLSGTPSLNVNAGKLTFQGDNRLLGTSAIVNLNSTAAAGIDLNNTTQTLGALNGVGSVAVGTGTLTIQTPTAGADSLLSGPVSGSGSLVKLGVRAQRLTADNPFTGSITVFRGALILTGSNAAVGPIQLKASGFTTVAVAAGLTLSGGGTLAAPSTQPIAIGPVGSLSLANDDTATTAASVRSDRVADGRPISLSGGTISFTGALQPAVSASETLGPLTIQPGGSTIRVSLHPDITTPGGPTALTFTDMLRQPGSSVSFTSLNSGGLIGGVSGTNPRLFFGTGSGSSFLPWATVATNYFAFYNGDGFTTNANGVQMLSGAAQVPLPSAGTATYAVLTGSAALAGPTTVTSLQVASTGTGQSLALGSNDLAITSGGLLKTGTQDYSITGTGTLGQPGTELIVHVASGTPGSPILTVSAPIAATGLTKAGNGALNLTANNTYTGTTNVGVGYLQVLNPFTSATDSATGAGPVVAFPGTLLLGGNTAGTAGQITGPVSVGGTLFPGTLPGTQGILTVRNSVTFSPDRTAVFLVILGGTTAGTDYSQLRVIGGDVVLNGNVLQVQSGTPVGPQTLIDVTGGTISGRFSNTSGVLLNDRDVFATYNGVPWLIEYTPTTVVLTPVPEPAGLLTVGALGLAAARRLRRRAAG